VWLGADERYYDTEEALEDAGVEEIEEDYDGTPPIPEIVSATALTLPGDKPAGARPHFSIADVEDRRNDVLRRLREAKQAYGPNTKGARLVDLFPENDGYEVPEAYRDVRLSSYPNLHSDGLYYQSTEDVALAGLPWFLTHVADNSRPFQPALTSQRTGVRFGRDVASLIVQGQTGVRPADENMQMLGFGHGARRIVVVAWVDSCRVR
jgi:hypothetical protein